MAVIISCSCKLQSSVSDLIIFNRQPPSFLKIADMNVSRRELTNGTIGDIETFLLVTGVAAPLYVVFLLFPSLLLNGSVVLVFLKKKDIRSPFNLLIINQCCAGIVSNLLNGFLFLVVDPIALKLGSCRLETILLGTEVWLHYGVFMLNTATVSVGMYFTLRYGASFITYRKVVPVIAVVWIYPGLWAAFLSYVVRDITSARCQTFTDNRPMASNSSGYPHRTDQVLSFIARDIMIDVVARVVVAVFSIASFRRFRKRTINPQAALAKRMLLLPILMISLLTFLTLSTGVLLIAINDGYGNTVSPNDYENSAILYVQEVGLLAVEYDAIAYVLLLIYFNTKLQRALKEVFSDLFCHCHQFHIRKENKVGPLSAEQPHHHDDLAPPRPIRAWVENIHPQPI